MRKLSFFFITCIFLSGCTSSVELKERAIVQSIGVDYYKNNYTITMQIFSFTGGEGEKKSEIVYGKGETITHAMTDATLRCGKRIFLGNNKMIVIGYDVAKKGIEEVLNFFNANHQSRPKTPVIISYDTAQSIVNARSKDGNLFIADKLSSILDKGKDCAFSSKSTVLSAITAIMHENEAGFVLTMVKANETEEGDNEVSIEGGGLFKGDKLLDIFSVKEVRGALWISEPIKWTIITGENTNNSKYTVLINSVNKHINAEIIGDTPTFNIKLNIVGSLGEFMQKNSTGADVLELKEIEECIKKQIFSEIETAINKSVYNTSTDIFFLSHYLYKEENKWWTENKKDFYNVLKQSEFNVDIKVNLERGGLEDKALLKG